MKAQIVYDVHHRGVIGGECLHRFFQETLGEPSPSGYAKINDGLGVAFLLKHIYPADKTAGYARATLRGLNVPRWLRVKMAQAINQERDRRMLVEQFVQQLVATA